MPATELWRLFQECRPTFLPLYTTYHHFRCSGWVVKNGVQFGADWVLYRGHPGEIHSECVQTCLDRDDRTWFKYLPLFSGERILVFATRASFDRRDCCNVPNRWDGLHCMIACVVLNLCLTQVDRWALVFWSIDLVMQSVTFSLSARFDFEQYVCKGG